jgi:hypothetical protein
MLVGGTKARHPERGRISKCSTEIGGRGPSPRRSCERIDDRGRIVREEALGEQRVIRPTARIASAGDESGQVQGGLLAQRDQIDGLAPRRPFLSTPGCRHLADHARQYLGCMLPADEVKTLERLVDEIERVSAIGVGTVRLDRKEEIREAGWRSAASNGG